MSRKIVTQRDLADHVKKPRSTVRYWLERPENPLAFTVDEKGRQVFDVDEVEQFLDSLYESDDEKKAASLAVKLATDEEKLRALELDNDEREFKKNQREGLWQHRDEYTKAYRGRYLQITAMVDKFIEDEKKMIPDLSASQSEEIDRRKVDFFNSVADLPRL